MTTIGGNVAGGRTGLWVSFLALAALSASDAGARIPRVNQIPNGGAASCLTCHVNANGQGARNAFGLEVQGGFLTSNNAAGVVTNWPGLCVLDSDGDGVNNGTELGDPDCVWTAGNQPAGPALSNPGDENSVPAVVDPPDDDVVPVDGEDAGVPVDDDDAGDPVVVDPDGGTPGDDAGDVAPQPDAGTPVDDVFADGGLLGGNTNDNLVVGGCLGGDGTEAAALLGLLTLGARRRRRK